MLSHSPRLVNSPECVCGVLLFPKFRNCDMRNEHVAVLCVLFNCGNNWLNASICFNSWHKKAFYSGSWSDTTEDVFFFVIVFSVYIRVCTFVFVMNIVLVHHRCMILTYIWVLIITYASNFIFDMIISNLILIVFI